MSDDERAVGPALDLRGVGAREDAGLVFGGERNATETEHSQQQAGFSAGFSAGFTAGFTVCGQLGHPFFEGGFLGNWSMSIMTALLNFLTMTGCRTDQRLHRV